MSIDPKILRRMQSEDAFLQSQTKGSRRVKLDRGHNWIVRFLPARMGPDGLWFARIAKHWVNRLPIVCPRNTAEDFGGDPEFHCPVCDLADELNDSADEIISKFGFKAKANPQFLTYCVVWEKNGVQQPMSEVLNPYEFNHYRSTWDELKGFYVAGGRRSGDSVLDYKTGNDFSVNKGARGLRLDKLDASPIFELNDPKFEEHIKKLEALMKSPKVVIPTGEQLSVFVRKMQEAADRGGSPDDDDNPRRGRGRGGYRDEEQDYRRGRGRARDDDREPEDDLPYDDAPPERPAARASSRRPAPEPEDDRRQEEPTSRRRQAPADDEPAPRRREEPRDEEPRRQAPRDDDPAPRRQPPRDEEPAPRRREEEPARRPRDEEPAPRRQAPRDEEPTPRRRDEEPAPRRRDEEPAPRSRQAPRDEEPAPRRRAEPEPEPEATGGDDPPPDDGAPEPEPQETEPQGRNVAPTGRRTLAPTERQQAARREAAASQPQAEEDDPLPEDDKDNQPPADKVNADDPPPVTRRGSQGADIKSRLEKLGRNA